MAWVTSTEVAKRTGLSRTTICKYIRERLVPEGIVRRTPSGYNRINLEKYIEWLETNYKRQTLITRATKA